MIITNVSKTEEAVVRNIKLGENFLLIYCGESLPLKFSKSLLEMLGVNTSSLLLKGDLIQDAIEIINAIKGSKEVSIALTSEEYQFLKFLYAISTINAEAKFLYNGKEVGKFSDLKEVKVTKEDVLLLNYISTEITISKLAKILNTSITTAWRRISELEKKGLIEKKEKGVKITVKGEIIKRISA